MTDESVSLVDSWVATNEPGYPIVILENGDFEEALGVAFFPTAAVIAPDGNLAYAGSASSVERPLDDALSAADSGPLFPKVLEDAMEAFDEGEFGRAYDEVVEGGKNDKLDDRERKWVDKMRAYFEENAVKALGTARADAEDGWIYRAHRAVASYAESEVGLPNAADLRSFLEELRGRDAFDDEMKAGERFAEVEELILEQEYTKAVKAYKSIYKRYADTALAKHARAAAQKLVDDQLPGYKSSCQSCKSRSKACARHAEDVKL